MHALLVTSRKLSLRVSAFVTIYLHVMRSLQREVSSKQQIEML